MHSREDVSSRSTKELNQTYSDRKENEQSNKSTTKKDMFWYENKEVLLVEKFCVRKNKEDSKNL